MWRSRTVQREKQKVEGQRSLKGGKGTEQVKGERREGRSQGERVLASSKTQLKL